MIESGQAVAGGGPVVVVGVIPARYASTRLPGKPLHVLAGRPLIEWVWRAASRCASLHRVLVATDDARIAEAVAGFGGVAVMTDPELPSGTDRIAAALAAEGRGDAEIVVNIQGDEPLLEPGVIDRAVAAMIADPQCHVVSAMVPLFDREQFESPQVVKVVCGAGGRALYFSRAPVPSRVRLSPAEEAAMPAPMKHLGLYVYRRAAIEAFVRMPPSALEMTEKLEQLRFLEAGYTIRMIEVLSESIGVDTPEDAARVEALLRAGAAGSA